MYGGGVATGFDDEDGEWDPDADPMDCGGAPDEGEEDTGVGCWDEEPTAAPLSKVAREEAKLDSILWRR